MDSHLKAVKITEKVFWVGAIDWDIRDFHGYSTNKGTTYNAYLIIGQHPVLIDTVKAPFKEEMLARISSVLDPASIKTIISNHAEMDHTGALPEVMAQIKPEKLICSVMGAKALVAHFHHNWPLQTVKDGETLDLGGNKITFYESRMLHWPDSMITLLHGDDILFSNDIFGMHLAGGKRFDDEYQEYEWFYEAAKYYANIILPYSDVVTAFLGKVKQLGLAPKIIAPDHGPIWRKDISKIMALYAAWAAQKRKNKAVVAYDTMWGSSALIAKSIADGLISGGTETKVMPIRSHHRSDIATELLDAGAFIVGSPTLNKGLFPTVSDILTYIKGLKPKGLIGNSFGSYGWSPDGANQVSEALGQMKISIAGESVQCQYVPDEKVLQKAFELGSVISGKLKAQ